MGAVFGKNTGERSKWGFKFFKENIYLSYSIEKEIIEHQRKSYFI